MKLSIGILISKDTGILNEVCGRTRPELNPTLNLISKSRAVLAFDSLVASTINEIWNELLIFQLELHSITLENPLNKLKYAPACLGSLIGLCVLVAVFHSCRHIEAPEPPQTQLDSVLTLPISELNVPISYSIRELEKLLNQKLEIKIIEAPIADRKSVV